jgi:hypothetical protein
MINQRLQPFDLYLGFEASFFDLIYDFVEVGRKLFQQFIIVFK